MNSIRSMVLAGVAAACLLIAPRAVEVAHAGNPSMASLSSAIDVPQRILRVPLAPSTPAQAKVITGTGTSMLDARVRVANIPSSVFFDLDDLDAGNGLRFVYYSVQFVACNASNECILVNLFENCNVDGRCETACNSADDPDPQGSCTRREFDPATDLGCTLTLVGSDEMDTCSYSVVDDRTTYQVAYAGGLALPEAMDRTAAHAYYAAGQSNVEVPCIPVREDDVAAGGLSNDDVFGDVSSDNENCNTVVVSESMDGAVDFTALDVSVETTEPPPPDNTGTVVLGLSASTPGPLAVGDPISYTLRLSNGSSSTIRDASCSAEGPAQRFDIESVSCGGDASIDGSTVFWNVGNLEPGQGMTCTFNGRVTAVDPGCAGDCELTLQAGAQFAGVSGSGSLSTRAVVGVLAPPSIASTIPGGAATTRDSSAPSLSADGAILAFSSYEKALVGGNANSEGADIYLRDGGGIRLISRTASGQLGGDNRSVDVALNGRAAAFVHEPGSSGETAGTQAKGAANSQLCASQPNSLFQMDCATTGADGAPLDGDVESPSMSADGRLVAFCSSATNWVAGDTNGAKDVFVRNQATSPATVTRVSVTASGEQGNGDSCDPMISGNGDFVVFTTKAANLGGSADVAQVVRKDLASGAITVITQNEGAPADADAGPPSISADGRRIAFASRAGNLVAGVANGARNVFVYDAASSQGTAKGGSLNNLFVMRGAGGQLPNGDSGDPKLACGGNALSVTSAANNLVPGDSNGVSDYFVYGLDSNRVVRPAPAATGEQPNGAANNAELDCDAQAGVYDSQATNDTNNPNPNADVTVQDDPLRSDRAAIVLDGSYSGNWYDPGQSGHGFLLEALPNGAFYATWYVYENGEPLFLQGVGTPVGNRLDVDMFRFTSSAFPVGPERPTATAWGRITFTFTSSNDGMASWQPVAAGFSAGSTTLRRLSNASRVESDRNGVLSACYSGIWYDRAQSGYGFNVEFNERANGGRVMQAFWYTYEPDGSPLWLVGLGDATPGGVVLDLFELGGAGAQFPPAFSAGAVTRTRWGSAILTFTPNRLDVEYESDLPGYGSGTLSGLQRLTVLDQRACTF